MVRANLIKKPRNYFYLPVLIHLPSLDAKGNATPKESSEGEFFEKERRNFKPQIE